MAISCPAAERPQLWLYQSTNLLIDENVTQLEALWRRYHPAVIYGGSVCICLSDPETQKLLADNARRVDALFHPAGMMMGHDEIRIVNSDAVCRDRHLDAGQLLADNARYCVWLLKGKQVYGWSDMWDPYHNAVDHYYLVQGNLAGSWEGLSRRHDPQWNFEKRDQSLKWFADRGHQQIIAGYFDESGVASPRAWMKSATKVKGVVGYMYTTWANKYDDLEAFAKLVRD